LGFCQKNPPRTWYLQPSTFYEPSFPHTIWAMPSPPTPGDPKDHSSPPTWSKEMGHHHCNAALPSRRPCSPPTGAASPASADSRPCSETHRATCEVDRVGTAKPEGSHRTTIRRRPSSTAVGSCRPDAVAGIYQPSARPGPDQAHEVPLPRCCKKSRRLRHPTYHLTPASTDVQFAPGDLHKAHSWPPQAHLATTGPPGHHRPIRPPHRPTWPTADPDRAQQRDTGRRAGVVSNPAAMIRCTTSQRTTPPDGWARAAAARPPQAPPPAAASTARRHPWRSRAARRL
jgi:hypothetical protein